MSEILFVHQPLQQKLVLIWIMSQLYKLLVQGDRWESDGFKKKKKYMVDFQLEMDFFLQN